MDSSDAKISENVVVDIGLADLCMSTRKRVLEQADILYAIFQKLSPDEWLALSLVSRYFLAVVDRADGALWRSLTLPTSKKRMRVHECLGVDLTEALWKELCQGGRNDVRRFDMKDSTLPSIPVHLSTPKPQTDAKLNGVMLNTRKRTNSDPLRGTRAREEDIAWAAVNMNGRLGRSNSFMERSDIQMLARAMQTVRDGTMTRKSLFHLLEWVHPNRNGVAPTPFEEIAQTYLPKKKQDDQEWSTIQIQVQFEEKVLDSDIVVDAKEETPFSVQLVATRGRTILVWDVLQDDDVVMLATELRGRRDFVSFRRFWTHRLLSAEWFHSTFQRNETVKRLFATRYSVWETLKSMARNCHCLVPVSILLVGGSGLSILPLILLPMKLDGGLSSVPYSCIFAAWFILWACMSVVVISSTVDLIRRLTCFLDDSVDPLMFEAQKKIAYLTKCAKARQIAVHQAAGATHSSRSLRFGREAAFNLLSYDKESLSPSLPQPWQLRLLMLSRERHDLCMFVAYGTLFSFVLAMLRVDQAILSMSWAGIFAPAMVPLCIDLVRMMLCSILFGFSPRPQQFVVADISWDWRVHISTWRFWLHTLWLVQLALAARQLDQVSSSEWATVLWPAFVIVGVQLLVRIPRRLLARFLSRDYGRFLCVALPYAMCVAAFTTFVVLLATLDPATPQRFTTAWIPLMVGIFPLAAFAVCFRMHQ